MFDWLIPSIPQLDFGAAGPAESRKQRPSQAKTPAVEGEAGEHGSQESMSETFGHYADAQPVAANPAKTAAKLDEAMNGWGTDEVAIHNELRGLSPSEVAKVKAAYEKRTGQKLDDAVDEELSGDEAKRAKELLEGKEPVQGKGQGLNKYEMVEDNHAGPLKPNQMRRSDIEELEAFEFDKIKIGPASKDDLTQMTQAQYDKLVQAWINIKHGKGIEMTGSDDDKEAFKKMLRGAMTDSPLFRELITTIGNDPNELHKITAKLGHDMTGEGANSENVFVDLFETNAIDLDDLAKFNTKVDPAHKNDPTQGEQLVHILAERRAASMQDDPSNFDPAHEKATREHNKYRAEHGQAAEVSAEEEVVDGKYYAVFTYADGSKKRIQTFKGKIVDMNPDG